MICDPQGLQYRYKFRLNSDSTAQTVCIMQYIHNMKRFIRHSEQEI
jgi:hypothetical protein